MGRWGSVKGWRLSERDGGLLLWAGPGEVMESKVAQKGVGIRERGQGGVGLCQELREAY